MTSNGPSDHDQMGNFLSHNDPNEPSDPVEKLRYQARQEFDERGRCFERSKAAYRVNDHSGAKTWSEKGQAHNKRGKELNAKAAEMCYEAKNIGRPPDEVDLHGLKVAEALAKVEQVLGRCKQENIKAVTFITGKGLHSGPEGPKLKPAVLSLVNKHSLRVEVVRGGALRCEFVDKERAGLFGWLDKLADCVIC